jgi:hypothetical protein
MISALNQTAGIVSYWERHVKGLVLEYHLNLLRLLLTIDGQSLPLLLDDHGVRSRNVGEELKASMDRATRA